MILSLRGAVSDEAISVSGKDCFAALAMTSPLCNFVEVLSRSPKTERLKD